jgi:uridine kinase
MNIPNLLLIAGTGTESGKTSMACRIIEQFYELNITAIKISPHFHEATPGLKTLYEEKGYSIYEETNRDTIKDTSRMLRSGAAKVYFAKVLDDRLRFVFD